MLKYFGTDGIRDIVYKSSLCETAFFVGCALSKLAKLNNSDPKVLIAKDTRLSGEIIEHACTAGLCAYGSNVIKLGIMPTPAAAYLTKLYECDYSIVISASHNPPEYNGIKIFDSSGKKLSYAQEMQLEELMEDKSLPSSLGKILTVDSPLNDYISYAHSLIQKPLRGLKLVLDCANGAASVTAAEIFKKAGASVFVTNNNILGDSINDACGATFPASIKESVRKYHADYGFSFDGDGDRILVADDKSNIYGGDSLLYIFSSHYQSLGRLSKNAVAGTIMSNMGMELSLKKLGIDLVRADVGDKFVLECMTEHELNLGGEESGHLILRDYLLTGDGVISAIELLNIIKSTGKDLQTLLKNYKTFPQTLINVTVGKENKDALCEDERMIEKVREWTKILDGKGRIILRPSGTEPKIRIMTECEDGILCKKSCEQLAEFIKTLT